MLHIRVVTTPGLTGRLLDRLADLPGIRNEVNANCSRARSVLVIATDHQIQRPPGPHPFRMVAAGAVGRGRRVQLTPAGGGGQGPAG
jgi:hypothetical protein